MDIYVEFGSHRVCFYDNLAIMCGTTGIGACCRLTTDKQPATQKYQDYVIYVQTFGRTTKHHNIVIFARDDHCPFLHNCGWKSSGRLL